MLFRSQSKKKTRRNKENYSPKDNEYTEDKKEIEGNYLEVSQRFPDNNAAYTEVWAESNEEPNELNIRQLQPISTPEFSQETEENGSLYRKEEESTGEGEQYLNNDLNHRKFYYSKKTSSSGRGTKSIDDALVEEKEDFSVFNSKNAINYLNNEANQDSEEYLSFESDQDFECNQQFECDSNQDFDCNQQFDSNQQIEEEEPKQIKKKEKSSTPKWKRSVEALRRDHEWLLNFSEQTPEPEAFIEYIDEIFKDFHDSIIMYGKTSEIKNLKAAKSYFRNRYCIGSPLMSRYNNKFALVLDPFHYERVDETTGKRYTIYGDAIPAGAPTYPGPPYTYYDKWRKEWRF